MSHIARRTGAQPGDLVCITGIPGQAQAYLDGYLQYQKALFEPQPRVKEGRLLARGGCQCHDGRQRRGGTLTL
jgi:thiamine-monophosphate kinase